MAPLSFILTHAWLIPAIPLVSFLLVGLVLRNVSQRLAGAVATLAVATSAALSWLLAWDFLHLVPHGQQLPSLVPWSVMWVHFQENFSIHLGTLLDPISVMLLVVVTTVSTLVHIYSTGYMHGEPGYARYFAFLNLFTFSMLGLVLAPNLVQMYVCWELVGASSFFLIGFYFDKPSAVSASKKAFIVTRFADLGFLLGILVIGFYAFQIHGAMSPAALHGQEPLDFAFLTRPDVLASLAGLNVHFLGVGVLTLSAVLIYTGGAGKSAMFPLHIWLPDAMEGPTPVSALIHAATMVVAGVYLVARCFPIFATSGEALQVVMCIGAFTSLFAAVIGCTQDDIKRVLAFSTLSQLGYMMFALGVASFSHPLGYSASMFHLFTHAFFKALLFLGAGSVIHAVHSNDIWQMGGLRKHMPVTHALFLIATLAISGIYPLAGFFSKDEILAAALHSGHTIVFSVGLLVAGMTAFYMFRIYFVTFWGEPKSEHAKHPHESPWVMLAPMVFLGVLSIVAGFIPIPEWVQLPGSPVAHEGIDLAVAIPSTILAFAGIGTAWLLYGGSRERVNNLVVGLGRFYVAARHKFYFDELYLYVTHSIIFRFVAAPIAWFDRNVVDGMVNLGGWFARTAGLLLGKLQTGQVQTYGSWLVSGVIAGVVLLWGVLKSGGN
jgi:NADH-quinone oxidoreductase subunit L